MRSYCHIKIGQVFRHEFSVRSFSKQSGSAKEKTYVIGGGALPAKSYALRPSVAGTVPWFWGDEKLKEQMDKEVDMNNSALLDSTLDGFRVGEACLKRRGVSVYFQSSTVQPKRCCECG